MAMARLTDGIRNNFGLVSDWFSTNQLSSLLDILQPGDLLEFHRGIYNHWSVFVGMKMERDKKVALVVHFAAPGDMTGVHIVSRSSAGLRKAGILLQRLADVLLGSRVRINNERDLSETPRKVQDIVQRAKARIGQEHEEYNVFTNNCEHFARYCRYGEKKSFQSDIATVSLGVAAGVAGLALLGGIIWAFSPNSNSSRRQRDY